MEEKRIALFTGSFDPITAGHMQMISVAAGLFDRLYVTVCANTEKAGGMFTPSERLTLVRTALACAGLPDTVQPLLCEGLVSDAAAQVGARYLVRGLRDANDFAYEYNLASIMKRFDGGLETIFLPAAPAMACISATYVRDLLRYGCPLGDAVPAGCADAMLEMLRQKDKKRQ